MDEPIKIDTDKDMEFAPNTGELIFQLADGSIEMMRMCPNGDVYVRGELVENNKDVLEGFKEWLSKANAST